jgi:hypothetical protein
LSIGTGHNGAETNGSAEPYDRKWRRAEITSEIIVTPSSRQRKLGFGEWFKNAEFVQNLNVMANRVDNILNSEQIWVNFKSDTLPSWEASNQRYQRINPKLGYSPPQLDDKGKLVALQLTVREKLGKEELYRKKISRIAHRLVASSFYFERLNQRKYDGGYICQGKFVPESIHGKIQLKFELFLRPHNLQICKWLRGTSSSWIISETSSTSRNISALLQHSGTAPKPSGVSDPSNCH